MRTKGQIGALIGIMLAVIVGVGVVLPSVISVLTTTNFSTFTLSQTIAGFIPVLLIIVVIVGIVGVMGAR